MIEEHSRAGRRRSGLGRAVRTDFESHPVTGLIIGIQFHKHYHLTKSVCHGLDFLFCDGFHRYIPKREHVE